MDLLQVLQNGDGATLEASLENATLTPGACGGPREALLELDARVRKLPRSDGGSTRAVFFDDVRVRDSIAVQVIAGDLIVVPVDPGQPVRTSVTLVLDPERGVWIAERGLVAGLCGE